MSHKATPEQWEHVERRILAIDPGCSCLLELRDRIAALEAAANVQPQAPARAGGLVERVAEVIINGQACDHDEVRTARAAILAVAEWLEQRSHLTSARRLREEVERHG